MRLKSKIKSFTYFSFVESIRLIGILYLKQKNNIPNLVHARELIEFLLQNDYRVKNSVGTYIISAKDGFKFYARKNSSDGKVFKQVILNKEYLPLINLLREKKANIKTIIDCGANVGYTSIFFKSYFPEAQIILVEPDMGNCEIIKKNIIANNLGGMRIVNKGIWHRSAWLKVNKTFRDGQNWAFILEECSKEAAETVATTIDEIVKEFNLSTVDILKVDIEGAERFIFEDAKKVNSMMKKIDSLAIEIHDEFDFRKNIYRCLKGSNYTLTESGELTIGIKNV